jgi:ATPase subunit of ABC transporter with duplicated ATPase domains
MSITEPKNPYLEDDVGEETEDEKDPAIEPRSIDALAPVLDEYGTTKHHQNLLRQEEQDNSSTPNLRKSRHSRQASHQSALDARRHKKRVSEVKLLRADAELLKADAVVVVLGPTGAGKSKFIREATSEDVEVGDSLQSGISLLC